MPKNSIIIDGLKTAELNTQYGKDTHFDMECINSGRLLFFPLW